MILSETVRNARLDAIETAIGVSAKLLIYTGAPPIDTLTAETETLLATLSLPLNWMSNAALGVKSLLGTWSAAVSVTGVAGHFRFMETTATTCHMQGWISDGTYPGDLVLSNVNLTAGDTLTITSFDLTDGNVN